MFKLQGHFTFIKTSFLTTRVIILRVNVHLMKLYLSVVFRFNISSVVTFKSSVRRPTL